MPVYVFGEIDTRSSDIPVAAGAKNVATPPLLYFVMEFIGGTDVDQMLRQQGRLPPEHALAKSGIKPPSRSPRSRCHPHRAARAGRRKKQRRDPEAVAAAEAGRRVRQNAVPEATPDRTLASAPTARSKTPLIIGIGVVAAVAIGAFFFSSGSRQTSDERPSASASARPTGQTLASSATGSAPIKVRENPKPASAPVSNPKSANSNPAASATGHSGGRTVCKSWIHPRDRLARSLLDLFGQFNFLLHPFCMSRGACCRGQKMFWL